MSNVIAGRAYVTIGAKMDRLYKDLRRAKYRIRRWGQSIGDIGSGMTRAGAAVIAPLAAAVTVGAQFEERMSEVRAVTSATADDMAALEAHARELGKSTTFTASQVAEGMVALGRAGLKTGQIIDSIAPSLDLARASGMELSDVAGQASMIRSAFGLVAKETTNVADVLAYVGNNSQATIGLITESMAYAATAAKSARQPIESVASALGVLANKGQVGSMAGTQLARVLVRMSDSGVQETLRKINVEVKDSSGNFRDLGDIISDIKRETSGMGSADFTGFLSEAFGVRGMRAAQILVENVDAWSQFREELKRSGGEAARTRIIMEDNLAGAARIAVSALSDLANTIEQSLAPTLRGWLGWIQQTANSLNAWSQENRSLVIGVAKLGAGLVAAGAALIGFSVAAKGVAAVMGGAAGLVALTKALAVALPSLSLTYISLTPSVAGLAKSMVALSAAIKSQLLLTAGSIVKVFSEMGVAFTAAGGGLAGLGNAAAIGATGLAAMVPPALALAAALGGLAYLGYKVWNYFRDAKAIRETHRETNRLYGEIENLNREMEKMNDESEPLNTRTARAEIVEQIRNMKKLGKTDEQIRKQMIKNIISLEKAQKATWDKSHYLSRKNFDRRKEDSRSLLHAWRGALDERLDLTVKTLKKIDKKEKESARRRAEIQKELLSKWKNLQAERRNIERNAVATIAESGERRKYQNLLEKDPRAAAAMARERAAAAGSTIRETRRDLDRADEVVGDSPDASDIEYREIMTQNLRSALQEQIEWRDREREALEKVNAAYDTWRKQLIQHKNAIAAMKDEHSYAYLPEKDKKYIESIEQAIEQELKKKIPDAGELERIGDRMEGARERIQERAAEDTAKTRISASGSFSAREIESSGGEGRDLQRGMLAGINELVKLTRRQVQTDGGARL